MTRTALLATGFRLLTAFSLLGCSSQPLDVPVETTSGAGTGAGSPELPGGYSLIEYPAGPYGRGVGSVVENLEFLGWHDPLAAGYDTSRFEVVRLSDYYNPTGAEAGPRLIVINASAVWCAVCRAEFEHFHDNDIYDRYRAQGVEILGALFEDDDYQPAKPEDLALWGSYEKHAVRFPLLLDPGFKLGAYFAGDVTPLNMLVDARTMTIVDITMGYDPTTDSSYWQLIDQLLATL